MSWYCAKPIRADIKHNNLSHLYMEGREKYAVTDGQKSKPMNVM